MHKKLIVSFLILLGLCNITLGQESLKNDFLNSEELIEDYDFLLETLEETHPNLYAYVPEEEFVEKTNEYRKLLQKPSTLTEFYKVLYKTIALVKQGHTMVFGDAGFSSFKKNGGLCFPFTVEYYSEHVYINQNFSSNQEFVKGTELIAINRIPVAKIIESFVPYLVVRPNGYVAKTLANNWVKLLWLEYGFCDEFTISYILPNSNEIRTTKLEGVSHDAFTYVKGSQMKADFEYILNPERNLALMTINTFEFQYERFDSLLRGSFKDINENEIDNLIIDVRENHGGNASLVETLVDYLTDKPYIIDAGSEVKTSEATKLCYTSHPVFINAIEQARKSEDSSSEFEELLKCFLEKPAGTLSSFPAGVRTPGENKYRFEGNLYVLTSKETFSGGTAFSVIIKDNDIGYIVGSETSDNPSDYGCIMLFELPNSKITIQNSTQFTLRPAAFDDGRGVIPDYQVTPTYSDMLSGYDKVLNYTYWLIEENISCE